MQALRSVLLLLPLLFAPLGGQAASCDELPGTAPSLAGSTSVPPLTSELSGRPLHARPQNILLAESRDESLALDKVLLRLQRASCTPAVKDEFANYKPRTQFDNTPWRFNMDKSKKFTAEQFDAWMKSRGVRVARGKAQTTIPAASTGASVSSDAVSD